MPYRVRKKKDKYQVQVKRGTKWVKLTDHATKEKAKSHLAALHKNVGH